ncbi:hypothetical protein BX616_006571 [Lobosporangium transversale]|uniref:RING-type E3 ubiquitin transferase n=1 Tax=Lobosporangium transversale TaxID=64571 RepID=A0A1Y2GLB8_9FUNG|nr:hypothetical protein BCR41DRAFT_355421 [Lobosporangium transversale]KAF9915247.1 hypothetical protein BX616_006571 [Lobosporangium transversale]ORZ13314.1 hypothetical protein BCR41DRAFT_355421 [Lobosporangium transversale]|eukprot:XP_021880395.1 hypothetical protein BCR41DRAFT_355421 [Lobosporangium transversale]
MSSDINSNTTEYSTLTLENTLDDLPEHDNEQSIQQGQGKERHIPQAYAVLASLNSTIPDIQLKQITTVVGRDISKCSEGAVLADKIISKVHCELLLESLTDPGAVVYIKDVSTNGVWVNDTKIPKDELCEITHRDIITFKPGPHKSIADGPTFVFMDQRKANSKRKNVDLDASTLDSTSASLEVDTKKKRKLEDSKEQGRGQDESKYTQNDNANQNNANDGFEKEFGCGICYEIMHKPVVMQPCLHAFCKKCCKTWFRSSSNCPACRQVVNRTKKDFRLNNLIQLFIESRPELKRDDEDNGAESDVSDLIGARSDRRRRYDYGHSDDDEEDEEDEENEDEAAQPVLLPPGFGLPPSCPCCDSANTLGYVCPDAVRLGPLPGQATYADYYARRQIQPGHAQCPQCRRHIPSLPATVPDAVADKFRCKMCQTPSCGCGLKSVEDRIEGHCTIYGFLNHYEERVALDYMAAENLTSQNVWEEIKAGMDRNMFHYLVPSEPNARVRNSAITSADKICHECSLHFFRNGPLFQWRKNLDSNRLPAQVAAREDCWWGRECRTQYNPTNPTHATRRNHICERRHRNNNNNNGTNDDGT